LSYGPKRYDQSGFGISSKKVSLLGKKQGFRLMEADGRYTQDVLGLREEPREEAARIADVPHERVTPLLEKVMENGRLLHRLASLEDSRTLLKRFHTRNRENPRRSCYRHHEQFVTS
jgi:hypothetical protein